MTDATGTALKVAGGAVAAGAQAIQSTASETADKYNEAVDQVNATNATNEAAYNASLTRTQLYQTVGTQKAQLGASDVTGGSSEYVTEDSLVQGEQAALAQTYQGKIAANNDNNQAYLADQAYQTQVESEPFELAATALGTATSIYQGQSATSGSGITINNNGDTYNSYAGSEIGIETDD